MLMLSSHASAQYDIDPELRIQQLEQQLRTLTGQNEELQHRNRMLEQQLRQLQPGQASSGVAATAPASPGPQASSSQQPGYDQRGGQPPLVQEQAATAPAQGRRGDAFDPSQNPGAPGAPRALGGGQMPIPTAAVGSPGGREAGAPLDLANVGPRSSVSHPAAGSAPLSTGGLTTLPPSATPRDQFDLGIGYMQRKDYALAEETMRSFTEKYPSDTLTGDAQYWLGESLFQRQKYREAAEAFLGVTTKYDSSAKVADALLRLGQSLAALKEKEAACAAFGEVTRKYPRASAGVKQAVDREQRRVKC
ncbi:TPR repeat protein [Nitrobacter winogradskyi Nb-255]|uniref:Cell division coordinator CpoB n=2 Tax=Nitrobacter winogradskyi TaxID=913 RepID=Q3SP25_NITWN|nr:TPR repeat protein [Nitrobacter winogradskyi Nb-255]